MGILTKDLKESQSLFYWKLLCNNDTKQIKSLIYRITILILLETPLQCELKSITLNVNSITILILLETPLQLNIHGKNKGIIAITILILLETPLQLLIFLLKI